MKSEEKWGILKSSINICLFVFNKYILLIKCEGYIGRRLVCGLDIFLFRFWVSLVNKRLIWLKMLR